MKQIFTVTGSMTGGGRDVAPFVVLSGTNPITDAAVVRMPVAGTIRNFRIVHDSAPGTGESKTFQWVKNTVTQSLAVTVSDAETEAEDLVNEVTFAEGDELSVDTQRSSSSAVLGLFWFSFEFEGDVANESIYGAIGVPNGTVNSWACWMGGWRLNVDDDIGIGVARAYTSAAGSFTKLLVRLTDAPGSGKSYTFNVVLNGVLQDGTGGTVDTTLTIADSDTHGTATFDLPVGAGDAVTVQSTPANTPAGTSSGNMVLVFQSTNPAGVQHLASAAVVNPTASSTTYNYPIGADGFVGWSTEAARHLIGAETPLTITGWTIRQPGALSGDPVTYTCRVNGADTGLSVTLLASDTEKTATGSVEIGPGDTWSVKAVASGTISSTNTPDWTWITAEAQSSRNLLVGSGHTVTGSDNVIAGESGTVAGSRVAMFNMKDGVPDTYTGDNAFIVNADVIEFNGAALADAITDLTGDVTASGPGSVAATIANDAVTYAKMQNVSAASKLLGRGDSGSGDVQEITLGTGLSMSGTTLSSSGGSASSKFVGVTIDGAGSVITTGVKGFVVVPITGDIVSATLLSTDASVTSGSIVIDVWSDTYANYPPTDADSITASAPPTISGATKSQDTTLTGWTTSVTAGDILGFNVDSATSLTRVTLVLEIEP